MGLLLGGAFGKIVTSLVNDIIMPLVGVVTGGGSFASLNILLRPDPTNPLTLNYGSFIQTTIDFLIIAMSIFVAIKAINKFSKKQEARGY
ncbi:large conductance mechanosensitive channel protein MscL [Erysipelothrix sp. D19-032]